MRLLLNQQGFLKCTILSFLTSYPAIFHTFHIHYQCHISSHRGNTQCIWSSQMKLISRTCWYVSTVAIIYDNNHPHDDHPPPHPHHYRLEAKSGWTWRWLPCQASTSWPDRVRLARRRWDKVIVHVGVDTGVDADVDITVDVDVGVDQPADQAGCCLTFLLMIILFPSTLHALSSSLRGLVATQWLQKKGVRKFTRWLSCQREMEQRVCELSAIYPSRFQISCCSNEFSLETFQKSK